MEGFLLNEQTWLQHLKEKRLAYGLSQNRLAVATGITRQYLSDIETGKVKPSEDLQQSLWEALERFNPDAPLEMLFDYVRIRFPTTDVQQVVENILQLKLSYFLHEDYGFYSYSEHYALGDIFVLCSHELDKGVLVELKGRGCRQFESYLLAQQRSWYEFFMDVLVAGGVMKRLDLAINDKTGILNIPVLTEKCQQEECISVFRSFKSYRSGERQVPMVEEAYQAFKRVLANRKNDKRVEIDGYSDFLFLNRKNYPKVASDYNGMMKGLVKKYNKYNEDKLPHITPHSLRHTFCTNYANAGMNPKALQYIMGHANIAMTLNYYAHATFDSAMAEMKRLNKEKQQERLVA